jgi:hypothetical protein
MFSDPPAKEKRFLLIPEKKLSLDLCSAHFETAYGLLSDAERKEAVSLRNEVSRRVRLSKEKNHTTLYEVLQKSLARQKLSIQMEVDKIELVFTKHGSNKPYT